MPAMVLENVCVEFPIYGAHRNFRKVLFDRVTGGLIAGGGRRQERVIIKALVNVSLWLEDGDRLGLIGPNGSGKSTILKVMAGVYPSVSGNVRVEGRITPLFDTMPGLDGEDTGYENIITAGMLLGMSRAEIQKKIPEIEEFSELGEYLSLPVRTYSAGMGSRLGFSVATAMDPGILLIDEGIGAGDARFMERATKRMTEFIDRSQILVIASHSDEMILKTCNKAALMHAGHVVAFGPVRDVVDQYHEMSKNGFPPINSAQSAS